MPTIRTITSADIVFTLAIAGIFSTPVQLQGYEVDDAFSQGEVDHAELRLGVDAQIGAGYVPALIPMKFAFLPSSPSIDLFEQWARTNSQQLQTFVAQGNVIIPGVKKSYSCIDGFLSGYMPIPVAKKVLGPRTFTITWSDIQPSPTL